MHVYFCGLRFSFFSTISASELQHCVGVHGRGEDQRAKVVRPLGRRANSKSPEGWSSWGGDVPLPTSCGAWEMRYATPVGFGVKPQ